MESKVEKNFKNTIGKIFGEDGWNDIKLLYEKVIEKREENLKNEKFEDGCGKYGDDSTTIELMLYIRKMMRENKLIPSVPLINYIQSQPLTIEDFNNFIEHDDKNRSWLTKEYKKRFPISYGSEPESHLDEYHEDGWDYSEYQKRNFLDADIEWFFQDNAKIGHIYYNELDHYLTYLVGTIRKNKKNDRIRRGKYIKVDLGKIS